MTNVAALESEVGQRLGMVEDLGFFSADLF